MRSVSKYLKKIKEKTDMVKFTTDTGDGINKKKSLQNGETKLENGTGNFESNNCESLCIMASNNEISQTDHSDLSESEPEELGIIHSCPALHEGRLLLQMELPFNVDHIFTLLFTDSEFNRNFHETRKNTDFVSSKWELDPVSNQKVRKISLTVPINQPVGPKCSQITEKQVLASCSKAGQMYVIDVESLNAGIPYADSFYITSHFCIVRNLSLSKESTLSAYCQIKYKKSVWGLVKNFIEKSCWSGLEEYYAALFKALQMESEKKRLSVSSRMSSKRKISNMRKLHVNVNNDSSQATTLPTASSDDSPSMPLPMTVPLRSHQYSQTSSNIFSLTILTILLMHIAVVSFFYYKLWSLEEFYYKQKNLSSLQSYLLRDSPPHTDEEWVKMLYNQELFYKSDLEHWNKRIKETINLLRKVEASMKELESDVRSGINENIINILKDSLNNKNSENNNAKASDNKKTDTQPLEHSKEEL